MSNEDVESGLSRRDLLRILAGVAAANGLGAATWGALEALVPAGSADIWHKSVCRFCGTGCGVLVGMRDGRVARANSGLLDCDRAEPPTLDCHAWPKRERHLLSAWRVVCAS